MNNTSSGTETLNGQEMADNLFRAELKTAENIGEVRQKVDDLVSEVGGDGKAGERLAEIKASVNEATEGGAHDNIQLQDDLGGSAIGMNTVGTKESLLRRDQLDPETVTADTRHTMDTVLHENSEELGHAGQDPKAIPNLTVIDEKGDKKVATTVVEGNVVSNVSARLGKRPEGLPKKTYVEGADFVEGLGRQKVDSYIRKGGANVGKPLQTEVWRSNTRIQLGEMLEQGAAVGMSREQVLASARELGKIPAGAEKNLVVAA